MIMRLKHLLREVKDLVSERIRDTSNTVKKAISAAKEQQLSPPTDIFNISYNTLLPKLVSFGRKSAGEKSHTCCPKMPEIRSTKMMRQ